MASANEIVNIFRDTKVELFGKKYVPQSEDDLSAIRVRAELRLAQLNNTVTLLGGFDFEVKPRPNKERKQWCQNPDLVMKVTVHGCDFVFWAKQGNPPKLAAGWKLQQLLALPPMPPLASVAPTTAAATAEMADAQDDVLYDQMEELSFEETSYMVDCLSIPTPEQTINHEMVGSMPGDPETVLALALERREVRNHPFFRAQASRDSA